MASISRKWRIAIGLLLASCLSVGLTAGGQQPTADRTELQQLKSDLQRIEARIDALEKAQQAATTSAGTAPGDSVPPQAKSAMPPTEATAKPAATEPDEVKKAEDSGMDTMDAGMGGDVIDIPHLPEMKFRGFADVQFTLANQNLAIITNSPGSPTAFYQGGNDTFTLGIMDLFLTSQITPHWSYLAEIGFQADTFDDSMGVDLERTQVSWTPSQKFSVNIGRSHAMLGYYNTAFHHGTWFQTTINRPRFFEFEDQGGPLPVHNVGVEAMGAVPSGKLGLHWLAEVGNGKLTYSLGVGPSPANVLGDHTGKSTNVGLLMRPEPFPGFQAGFNWYQAAQVPVIQLLPGYGEPGFPFPNAASYYHQNLYVAHVVYITPKFEFMAEDGEIGDKPRGSSQTLWTSGGYVQVSKAFNSIRPYARFEWMNPNFNDPNVAWAGHWVGPLGGVRWDTNTFVALKLEYQHSDWRNFSADSVGNQLLPILHKTINQLNSQITFTF